MDEQLPVEDQPKSAAKRFTCHICDKTLTKKARHLIEVHKVDPTTARGLRYDQAPSKRKKSQCPLCQRYVVNLTRHVLEVEKLSLEEWRDMASLTRTPAQTKRAATSFNIPANHPQRELLVDFVDYRKELEQRCDSTIKKETAFIRECLEALHKTGDLRAIFKAPQSDKERVAALFRARILLPLKRSLQQQGDRVASSHYNKLLAFSTFLKWLLEARPLYLTNNNMTPEVQILRTSVKGAMAHFRAAKKTRTIAINQGTKPVDLKADLPVNDLLKQLKDERTWGNLTKVRDSLITILAVGSISRLGALRNMTKAQFAAAEPVEEDDNLVKIEVAAHKTWKTYGAASIYMTRELRSFVERYLKERPMTSPWVFCTMSGRQVTASQAASLFKKFTDTTATRMRKGVAVAHRESPMDTQTAISEAMLHSMAVHKESYAAKTHARTIFRGLRAVGAVQCLSGDTEHPVASTSKETPAASSTRGSSDVSDSEMPQSSSSVRIPRLSGDTERPVASTPTSSSFRHDLEDDQPPMDASDSETQAWTDEPSPSTARPSPPGPSADQPSTDIEMPQSPSTVWGADDPPSCSETVSRPSPPVSPQAPSAAPHAKKTTDPQALSSESSGEDEQWLPSRMESAERVPGAGLLRFDKPLKAADPVAWPKDYVREERVLRGIDLSSRNKFTIRQLQTAFRYMGGYRRQTCVPAELVKRLRIAFLDFDDAFRHVSDKRIIDKIRSWPTDEYLIF